MTPYAELLVRPTDTDEAIRKAYHASARLHHPDRPGAAGQAGTRWTAITEAYAKVKTLEARAAWFREVSLLSSPCTPCGGFGVRGSRVGGAKIKVCETCGGRGRAR